jgi:hypothetical protein
MSPPRRAKEPDVMKFRLILLLLLGLGPGVALAQLPDPTPIPPTPPPAPIPLQMPAPQTPRVIQEPVIAPPPPVPAPAPTPTPTWIFSGDWLHWWSKTMATPPLLTTSYPADNGVIGQPTTAILAGGNGIEFDPIEGFRLLARYALNDTYAVEVSGFYLSNGGRCWNVFADVLAIPYVDPTTGQNASLVLASTATNGPSGYAAIQNSTQLWNMEAQGTMQGLVDLDQPIELIAGLRYMQLTDDLRLWSYMKTNATTTFVGASMSSGTTYTGLDEFWTRNHFVGAQAGLRSRWRADRCTIEGTLTLGLGSTHQEVNVYGYTNVNIPPQATAIGSVFSQTTNIGRYSRDVFAIVPQGRITVGYFVFDLVHVFIGYDVLYWNNVVRAASQIDPQVSPSLIPLVSGSTRVGTAPPPRLITSDYWALGLSLGLDIAF